MVVVVLQRVAVVSRVTTDIRQNPGATPNTGEVVMPSLKTTDTMQAQMAAQVTQVILLRGEHQGGQERTGVIRCKYFYTAKSLRYNGSLEWGLFFADFRTLARFYCWNGSSSDLVRERFKPHRRSRSVSPETDQSLEQWADRVIETTLLSWQVLQESVYFNFYFFCYGLPRHTQRQAVD